MLTIYYIIYICISCILCDILHCILLWQCTINIMLYYMHRYIYNILHNVIYTVSCLYNKECYFIVLNVTMHLFY